MEINENVLQSEIERSQPEAEAEACRFVETISGIDEKAKQVLKDLLLRSETDLDYEDIKQLFEAEGRIKSGSLTQFSDDDLRKAKRAVVCIYDFDHIGADCGKIITGLINRMSKSVELVYGWIQDEKTDRNNSYVYLITICSDLGLPITSDKEFQMTLQYISDQFYCMFDLIRNLTSQKLLEATFNESPQSIELGKYKKTINEVRKCQAAIDRYIASVQNRMIQESTTISHDVITFEEISNCTESLINFVRTYNKYNNKGLLPSVVEACKMYDLSLREFTRLVNINNKIDPNQKIGFISYLPQDIL